MKTALLIFVALGACIGQQSTVPIGDPPPSSLAALLDGNFGKVGIVEIGYTFSSLSAPGAVHYLPIVFPCTIKSWMLVAASGTASVDVWKASGTSLPTSGNSITASSAPALVANQVALSSALTGWTTSVRAGDVIAFSLTARSVATPVTVVLGCLR